MKFDHPPLLGIGTRPGVYITQKFGEKKLNYTQFDLLAHNGTDYIAPTDDKVYAVKDGNVYFDEQKNKDGSYKGYGRFARLYFDSDDFTWEVTYGHLNAFEGQNRQVKAGDVIGYVDSTGFSTFHHLHFGLRKLIKGTTTVIDYDNGYKGSIDPESFFMPSQTKVVKSKFSQTVFLCYPIPSEQHLKERSDLEGFEIPSQIPDTDSLK